MWPKNWCGKRSADASALPYETHPPRPRHVPRALREAPRLDPDTYSPPITPRLALLINPFYPKDARASFGKHVLTPSLALTAVAGSTPPHWQVRYWDENLLQGPPPTDPMPQVVGITVHLTFARRACELADWYRARGAKVVFGGLHVMSCSQELAPHADALALGEGVQLWPHILADVEADRLQRCYEGRFIKPYRDDPPPRRSILMRGGFLTTASLIATRGCHNRCGFCYLATDGVRMPYQVRDPQQIVEELAATGEPYGVFTDNNLGSKPAYLYELCQALRPMNRIWSAAVSVDVADDPQLVREMALAGCTGVFVGFETLSDSNLAWAGKKSPSTDDYARRVALFQRWGIQVNASFVFGFDDDGPEVFERTVHWVQSNRLQCATFHILTPYPGTPLFRQLETQGRILHRHWDLYDTAHVVFQPRKMSVEQLAAGYAWCYEQVFSLRSIWRRRPLQWNQALPYLAMSLLYKKSNWLWPLLIRHRLTHRTWWPLVEVSRRRHVRWRQQMLGQEHGGAGQDAAVCRGV